MDDASNAVLAKSKRFALRTIKAYRHFSDEKREFVLSRQMLRSGISIGANVREAQRCQSERDFAAKLYIALKEADETAYWLELLHESGYMNDNEYNSIYGDCEEIVRLLVSITKTVQRQSSPKGTGVLAEIPSFPNS